MTIHTSIATTAASTTTTHTLSTARMAGTLSERLVARAGRQRDRAVRAVVGMERQRHRAVGVGDDAKNARVEPRAVEVDGERRGVRRLNLERVRGRARGLRARTRAVAHADRALRRAVGIEDQLLADLRCGRVG